MPIHSKRKKKNNKPTRKLLLPPTNHLSKDVQDLINLPDISLGEMHFRIKVKSSNRISRRKSIGSNGSSSSRGDDVLIVEPPIAMLTTVTGNNNSSNSSSSSYNGIKHVEDTIETYNEFYSFSINNHNNNSNNNNNNRRNKHHNNSKSTSKTDSLKSLHADDNNTISNVDSNVNSKKKSTKQKNSPSKKKRKLSGNVKNNGKDIEAADDNNPNLLDASFVGSALKSGGKTVKKKRKTDDDDDYEYNEEDDDKEEEKLLESPSSTPKRKNNNMKKKSAKNGIKYIVLKRTRFPNKNLLFENAETYVTIHEVDENTNRETDSNKKFKVGDAIDVYIEPSDVGQSKLVRYWLKRCLNWWTTARVIAVSENMIGFQLEYESKKLSSTFTGCLPLYSTKEDKEGRVINSKLRHRGMHCIQENKDLIRLLNAVESEHVRIDKSILWTYPVENEWVLSANKKELYLWPSYAKDIVFTLLCISAWYENKHLVGNNDVNTTTTSTTTTTTTTTTITTNNDNNNNNTMDVEEDETINNFQAIPSVFRTDILLSHILSYLSLINCATHEPLEESKKSLETQKKIKKKIKRANIRNGASNGNDVLAPVGNDRSAFRKRTKNERRIELRLTLSKRSLSIWRNQQYEAIHMVDGYDPDTGMKNGKIHALSWDIKRLDPYMSHNRKPWLGFLQLLEHVAEHNFTTGFTRGPHRPRIERDDCTDNLWRRCTYNNDNNSNELGPYPTDFTLKGLLESTKPSKNAPLMNEAIPNLISTLMPYQSRCVRWMLSVERKEYAKHIPKDEGYYGFRSIVCVNHNTNNTRPIPSVKQQQKLFIHTTLPHIVSLNINESNMYRDIYPVGGILADEMGLGKTVEIIALILSRSRPVEQYKDVLIPQELKKKAGVLTVTNNKSTNGGTSSSTDSNNNQNNMTNMLKYGNFFDKKKLRSHQDDNDQDDVQLMDTSFGAINQSPKFNAEELPVKATLIVVPQTILQQWCDEFDKHAPSLKIVRYNGMSASNNFNQDGVWVEDFSKADVVLTTYKVLREDERNNYTAIQSPLLHCEWWRIVLDEAQMVRSVTSVPSKLVAKLYRSHAWCSSGSPLSDRIQSLIGLFEVLDFDPVRDPVILRRTLLTPYESGSFYGLARLSRIMQRVFWRHRKAHVQDQITLHSCNVIDDWLSMDPLEQLIYRKEQLDWDRKLLRQNMAPTDETRLANRRIVSLLQVVCHPSISQGRRINVNDEENTHYMLREAKRLYNGCLDKYVNCLREYCSSMVALGRGMYAHEVRELQQFQQEQQQQEQQFMHLNHHQNGMIHNNGPWQNNNNNNTNNNNTGQQGNEELMPGGVLALTTLRDGLEIIKKTKQVLVNNFEVENKYKSAGSDGNKKKRKVLNNKMKTFKTIEKLELSCLTDIQAICPGDKECESAILKIREKLELDIVEAGLAEGQRRNEQRSRRATTVVQTMQSVVALANNTSLKPLKSLRQTVKRTKMKVDEAFRDLKALSFHDTSYRSKNNNSSTTTTQERENGDSDGAKLHLLQLENNNTDVDYSKNGGSSSSSNQNQISVQIPELDVSKCRRDGVKIDRILYHIQNIQKTDKGAKTIIFSQFVSFLKLINFKIAEKLNIESVILSASSSKKIENTIEKFRADPQTLIMLIPMKTLGGAAGLSLTMAKYGIITSPSFDPTLEAQAVGRLYRIGQKSNVTVWRILVRNTADEEVEVRVKKHAKGV